MIKFVVSRDWIYQEESTTYLKELLLYGKFNNNKFIISEERNNIKWK